MKHLRRWWWCWLLVLLVAICGGILFLAVLHPEGRIGRAWLRLKYSSEAPPPEVLLEYAQAMTDSNGGYVPLEVQRMLLERLEVCAGTPEETAIFDFQLTEPSRRGYLAPTASEEIRGRMIAHHVSRLGELDGWEAVNALLFIEELRLGEHLGKPTFWGVTKKGRAPFQIYQEELDLAKDCYVTWWAGGAEWPENKVLDPLEGTSLRIERGP